MRAALLLPALLLPAAGLGAEGLDRALGKALFERLWVPAPASTDAADGLGPLFAERSCVACHGGPGGGASVALAPEGVVARGLSVRLGTASGEPDPGYGIAFQPRAVPGLEPEGTVAVEAESTGPLKLRLAPARGPLAPATRISPRLAPPLVTRGRLDLIAAREIVARADPADADGDGLSGRAHMVDTPAGPLPGRYGWKAEQPSLALQIAHAFAIDLGLSSPAFPLPAGDCTAAEGDCRAAPDGRSPNFDGEEISREMIGLLAGYVTGLEPPKPARETAAGERIFAEIGCAGCHTPALPAEDGRLVEVYSDILLHDMGDAFDDGVGAPGAAPSEWRTAPLAGLAWSVGATRRYLHDGRAATLDEAIRAHGGEAAEARSRYEALSADDRAKLIAFLEGL